MPDRIQEDILKRLKANNRDALKEIFEMYYSDLCQTTYRFIRDRNTVEDLTQEVFIRFWEKRHKLVINSSLKAYLHRMAINEALGYLRKNKRFTEEALSPQLSTETSASGEDQYLHNELRDNVAQAIDTLPPKCRTIFQLSRYEELTYREIAKKLDISVKTVENQMGKALKILRKKLRSYINLFF
ncbi:MAG: RNA polymerase sigma-70 factor [Bacteroidetes bacterium]|nr:RNA polymerase sigma-70 factor [Bacteroidota bacterium]